MLVCVTETLMFLPYVYVSLIWICQPISLLEKKNDKDI